MYGLPLKTVRRFHKDDLYFPVAKSLTASGCWRRLLYDRQVNKDDRNFSLFNRWRQAAVGRGCSVAELDVHRDCGIEQLGSASYLNTDGSLTMTQSSADNAVARAIWSSRQLCHSLSTDRRFWKPSLLCVCVCVTLTFSVKGGWKGLERDLLGLG